MASSLINYVTDTIPCVAMTLGSTVIMELITEYLESGKIPRINLRLGLNAVDAFKDMRSRLRKDAWQADMEESIFQRLLGEWGVITEAE
jgi:hypothetical protein